jgi:hypothetical protein
VFSLFVQYEAEGLWDGLCEVGVLFLFARVWMPESGEMDAKFTLAKEL